MECSGNNKYRSTTLVIIIDKLLEPEFKK
jgi:hypothetical protein